MEHVLQDEFDLAGKCLHRARVALKADLIFAELNAMHSMAPIGEGGSKRYRGGLAPWQTRRVSLHIEANLNKKISTKGLAALVSLSSFHFCRAFRDSFGDSPHRYLMRRRIERAQGLMLGTNASLTEIAAECGLADQAHLNRLFASLVGESPGAWRRVRTISPEDTN
jgi:AraC-like DNA-binding protein